MKVFVWDEGQQSPTWGLWWQDSTGALVNLATATLQLTIGHAGQANVLQTTVGLTGAAGAGVEPSGTPNVVIDPNAAGVDLLTVPSGLTSVMYPMWIRDTITGRDYPADLAIQLRKRAT